MQHVVAKRNHYAWIWGHSSRVINADIQRSQMDLSSDVDEQGHQARRGARVLLQGERGKAIDASERALNPWTVFRSTGAF